jgi:hypothetical protein
LHFSPPCRSSFGWIDLAVDNSCRVYAGHFAAGLAIKGRVPAAPTWILLIAVGLLDLLFGPFVLFGIERVTMTPGVGHGFTLDFIDWSHSLLMSLVWASLFASLFVRRGGAVALAAGAAVFSHFVLDLVVHPADLALWPGSAGHVGFGLWYSLPVGWWFVELAVVAGGIGYYWRRARADGSFGGRAWAVALTVLALHVLNAPPLTRR